MSFVQEEGVDCELVPFSLFYLATFVCMSQVSFKFTADLRVIYDLASFIHSLMEMTTLIYNVCFARCPLLHQEHA